MSDYLDSSRNSLGIADTMREFGNLPATEIYYVLRSVLWHREGNRTYYVRVCVRKPTGLSAELSEQTLRVVFCN
jgi:hypothetical protein